MCAQSEYTYVSADFRTLDIEFEVSKPVHERKYRQCTRGDGRPANWAQLVHTAESLAEPLSVDLVRVDLITNGCDVIHFSEYTFTLDSCEDESSVANQQLLALAMQDPGALWQLTSPVVECVIGVRTEDRAASPRLRAPHHQC